MENLNLSNESKRGRGRPPGTKSQPKPGIKLGRPKGSVDKGARAMRADQEHGPTKCVFVDAAHHQAAVKEVERLEAKGVPASIRTVMFDWVEIGMRGAQFENRSPTQSAANEKAHTVEYLTSIANGLHRKLRIVPISSSGVVGILEDGLSEPLVVFAIGQAVIPVAPEDLKAILSALPS